jgi:hypothetical protein
MADVRVGARASSDRWTVEVRIPWRRVVGDDVAVDESVWGFNVTRFDAANQEFSTWSGARGNAYDPLSLGNLYIPATPVDPRP